MADPAQQPKQYIEIQAGYSGGKPHIVGHRIKVQDVVVWHERMGLSVDEIAFQYGLALPEIYAALSYYFDHREQIEQDLRDKDVYVETMMGATSSILQEKLKQQRGN